MVQRYGQFCPVAKTAEIFCERWVALIVRELMCGSTRFTEIQRGLPLLSPSLLSKRLRQLANAGIVARTVDDHGPTYALTPAGWELCPLIEAMGVWGQRWARSSYTRDELDPAFLMWDVRRSVRPAGLSDRLCVVEIWFRSAPSGHGTYWMVVEPDEVDLCTVDPGRDVDLRVEADLRALTEVWMGDRTMAQAVDERLVILLGAPALAARFPAWLGCHRTLGGIARAAP